MKADPKVSLGARLERKAMRAYLRRAIRHRKTLDDALEFVLTRQERYDQKPNGLGR